MRLSCLLATAAALLAGGVAAAPSTRDFLPVKPRFGFPHRDTWADRQDGGKDGFAKREEMVQSSAPASTDTPRKGSLIKQSPKTDSSYFRNRVFAIACGFND